MSKNTSSTYLQVSSVPGDNFQTQSKKGPWHDNNSANTIKYLISKENNIYFRTNVYER